MNRPKYHYTPAKNWMNDPNGLLWHNGEYHLFYQYNPYGNLWGNMSWGHAVSKDLLTWEELPVAIEGDNEIGIFSGSAVYDAENTAGFGQAIVAIYTQATLTKPENQAQCLAYSLDKGRTFKKYEGNPVLDIDLAQFRDPKVLRHEDRWIMIAALSPEHKVSIYSSLNLKEWKHESDFHQPDVEGAVWECPDLFPLQLNGETHWVFILSLNPGGIKNMSGTKYFIGQFDGKTFVPTQDPQWLDWGRDNYAGVTFNDAPNGKRIFIGWMNHWLKNNRDMTVETVWNGSMTIPRELSLANHDGLIKLVQKPIASTVPLDENDSYIKFDTATQMIHVGEYTAPYSGDPKLRVLRDHGSVEVFTQDGTVAITMAGPDVI